MFFFKIHRENEAWRLLPDHFLFFKKDLCEVKASGLQLSFNIFWKPSTWHTIKTDYWSRNVLNFDFLENDLEIVSSPHFVYDFSKKMFLMLYSINWRNLIVWFLLLLEILGNICIAIVSFPGCGFINFKINLIFLVKPDFLHDQNVKAKA